MKLFEKAKDGGPDSTVWGYFLVEVKWLFSIVLLKFEGKSRPTYHSHAFNAVSWVLWGGLFEDVWSSSLKEVMRRQNYWPSFVPVLTFRDTFHKVDAVNPTWVLSFRGPWSDTWKEYSDENGEITLAEGRVHVDPSA
jgi:hypothetical protein